MHFTEAEEARLKLKFGDLLLCEGGDVGRTAMWRGEVEHCYYQNHLHRLRAINDRVIPEYSVYWFWHSFEIAKLYFGRGNVTTIPNLSRSKLAELPIALPKLQEQEQIADILDKVERKTRHGEGKKASLQALFRTLLHQLMTAEIRVNDLDLEELGLDSEL